MFLLTSRADPPDMVVPCAASTVSNPPVNRIKLPSSLQDPFELPRGLTADDTAHTVPYKHEKVGSFKPETAQPTSTLRQESHCWSLRAHRHRVAEERPMAVGPAPHGRK